jgi:hypothetical protein
MCKKCANMFNTKPRTNLEKQFISTLCINGQKLYFIQSLSIRRTDFWKWYKDETEMNRGVKVPVSTTNVTTGENMKSAMVQFFNSSWTCTLLTRPCHKNIILG